MQSESVEKFWGSTAYGPVKNRVFHTYPFGYHNKIQPTDFPRCGSNPYEGSNYIKLKLNQMQKQKDMLVPKEYHYNTAQKPFIETYENMTQNQKTAVEKEVMRPLLIIAFVCFFILSLFHTLS